MNTYNVEPTSRIRPPGVTLALRRRVDGKAKVRYVGSLCFLKRTGEIILEAEGSLKQGKNGNWGADDFLAYRRLGFGWHSVLALMENGGTLLRFWDKEHTMRTISLDLFLEHAIQGRTDEWGCTVATEMDLWTPHRYAEKPRDRTWTEAVKYIEPAVPPDGAFPLWRPGG